MKIEVALYASLSKHLPAGAQNRKARLEVKDGATVRDVMQQLGIPAELPNILLVDGRRTLDTTVLRDGQTLSIFPPLAGGCSGGPLSFPADPRPSGLLAFRSSRRRGSRLSVDPRGAAARPGEKPCPFDWV